MRSLILMTIVAAACGGPRIGARQDDRPAYDAEMARACTPDWQEPPPPVCEKNEAGQWVSPATQELMQALALYEDGVFDGVVALLDRIVADGRTTPCGLLTAHWYRGNAYESLGKIREAFMDYAAIIRAGPNQPFYPEVGDRIEALEAFLPYGVYSACMVHYDPPPPRVEGEKP